MGADKALLRLGGQTLIELAIGSFSGFSEILVSAADTERYAFTNVTIVPDERPGIGPIGGIISVLKAAASPLVCFRPVDAPLVPSALHPLLAAACAGRDAAAPVYEGKAEPLLACFAKTALPVLEGLAQSGNFKIADAFPLLNCEFVQLDSPELLTLLGDPSAWLVNANDTDVFSRLALRQESPD